MEVAIEKKGFLTKNCDCSRQDAEVYKHTYKEVLHGPKSK